MSVRTSLVEVICDGPDRQAECPDSAARAAYGTGREVRATLRDDGWMVGLLGGFDMCPTCQPARKARR
jgi:hypothetical protein